MPPILKAGDIVQFNYKSGQSHDPHPVILITNPNWMGKVWGINLNYLTDLQTAHLLCLAHPEKAEDISIDLPEVQKALKESHEIPNIKKYQHFYDKYLEKPVNRLNVYRCYRLSVMSGIQFRTAAFLIKYTKRAEQERERAKKQEEKYAQQKAKEEQKEQEKIDKARTDQESAAEEEQQDQKEQELSKPTKKKATTGTKKLTGTKPTTKIKRPKRRK